MTRDLLYDAATNKQFITVETSGGNTFTLSLTMTSLWTRTANSITPTLNMVDEADLLAALEAAGGELPACSCTENVRPEPSIRIARSARST